MLYLSEITRGGDQRQAAPVRRQGRGEGGQAHPTHSVRNSTKELGECPFAYFPPLPRPLFFPNTTNNCRVHPRRGRQRARPLPCIGDRVHLFNGLQVLRGLRDGTDTGRCGRTCSNCWSRPLLWVMYVMRRPNDCANGRTVRRFVGLDEVTERAFVRLVPLPKASGFGSPERHNKVSRCLKVRWVAGASARTSGHRDECRTIGRPPRAFPNCFFQMPRRDRGSNRRPSIAYRPTFPGLRCFGEVNTVVIPFVGRAIPRANTGSHASCTVSGGLIRPLFQVLLFFRWATCRFVDRCRAGTPRRPVPARFPAACFGWSEVRVPCGAYCRYSVSLFVGAGRVGGSLLQGGARGEFSRCHSF